MNPPRDPAAYFTFDVPTTTEAVAPVVLHPRTSRGTIACLILGLISLPATFIHIGLITALIGIACGITGLIAVKKGGGRIKGRALAFAGLGLCVGALVAWGVMVAKGPRATEGEEMGSAGFELRETERLLSRSDQAGSHGNLPAATAMATSHHTAMKAAFATMFPKNLSDTQKFSTYCRVSKNRCAFIVELPFHRKLDKAAQEDVAKFAWMLAYQHAMKHPDILPPGSQLCVAIRGEILYGSVQVGELGKDETAPHTGNDRSLLIPFFQPPVWQSPGKQLR